MDFTRIERPATPNTALAAPKDFSPAPDIVTPEYRLSAPDLLAAVRNMALAEPRVFLAADYPQAGQVYFVARSAVLNFPDLVAVQAREVPGGGSELVLYSRSVYGRSDLGVNQARLQQWLDRLTQTLSQKG